MTQRTSVQELVERLQRALTGEHLSRTTHALVLLYRSRNTSALTRIYDDLRRKIPSLPPQPDPARIFTTLIKMVHPDRLRYYMARLDEALSKSDADALVELKAVAEMKVREEPVRRSRFTEAAEETQWEPESTPDWEEPAWSHGEEDFDEVREYETADESDWEEADESHGPKDTSFLGALSMEEPGLADVVITPELLASIENSLDLSGYGISTLEGLRHCTGLVSLTLSANDIDDLEELRPLSRLEELFLSENRIEDIDPLSDLHSLREADLSFNQIRDITPLLGLSGLKLVNLVGNPVSQEQTRSLEERGVMVVV